MGLIESQRVDHGMAPVMGASLLFVTIRFYHVLLNRLLVVD